MNYCNNVQQYVYLQIIINSEINHYLNEAFIHITLCGCWNRELLTRVKVKLFWDFIFKSMKSNITFQFINNYLYIAYLWQKLFLMVKKHWFCSKIVVKKIEIWAKPILSPWASQAQSLAWLEMINESRFWL